MMATEKPTPTGKTQPLKFPQRLISPVVATLAQENQIDLNLVQGSGKGGRITKQDVLEAIRSGAARITREPAAVPSVVVTACLLLEVDLNRVDRSLQAWNDQHFDRFPLAPIDGILAAAITALQHYPQLTVPGEAGIHLLRPGAPAMILPPTMIEEPLLQLTARLQQSGKELGSSSPSFIIEDHSLTGITSILPALPAGQNALLAIGSLQRRPVAVTNTMVVHLTVNLSLVYAAQQVNNTEAADFLTLLKDSLEQWQ
jgi:pyruvate/2-oxoglutarate dehydrogenase complex dihydrolipoamide acyltransferase (E2) component